MRYRVGDIVVFEMEKHTRRPGQRARRIHPSPHGEYYSYVVAKYWRVEAVGEEDLLLRTPGGKLHRVPLDEPHLRRMSFAERLWMVTRDRDRLRALRDPVPPKAAKRAT